MTLVSFIVMGLSSFILPPKMMPLLEVVVMVMVMALASESYRPFYGLHSHHHFTISANPSPAPSVFNVMDYGARGDGVTNDTQAFIDAWKRSCQSQSPATMLVPRGLTFLVHPVLFSGPCSPNVSLQVAGKIIAPSSPLEWEDHNQNFWMGFEHVSNFLLEGGGVMDGQGYYWWACARKIYNECSTMSPPTLLRIHRGFNVKVANLKFINSPMTHINFHKSEGVEANNLEIASPANSPNTDGIHIHRSRNILIRNCLIASGDDCISIGTGTFSLNIQNISCGPGHGISIGSLGRYHTAARVSDIHVDGASMHETRYGVRIKTWQGGVGNATRITFQNILMYRVRFPILINQFYCMKADGSCNGELNNETSAVKVSDISYKNIRGTSTTKEAVRFACSEIVPCTNISMENIDLTYDANNKFNGVSISFCQGVKGIVVGNVIPPTCLH